VCRLFRSLSLRPLPRAEGSVWPTHPTPRPESAASYRLLCRLLSLEGWRLLGAGAVPLVQGKYRPASKEPTRVCRLDQTAPSLHLWSVFDPCSFGSSSRRKRCRQEETTRSRTKPRVTKATSTGSWTFPPLSPLNNFLDSPPKSAQTLQPFQLGANQSSNEL